MEKFTAETYRLIKLTKEQWAIVDASDYDWLNQWSWFAEWNPHTRSFYAVRNVKIPRTRKNLHIKMHRLILGLEKGDLRHGDHANGNTLDNRRSNLRIATNSQNVWNGRKRVTNTSGYKGVSFVKEAGKYRAQININGKRKNLGMRDTAYEAHHELYVPAAIKYYGEFARLS